MIFSYNSQVSTTTFSNRMKLCLTSVTQYRCSLMNTHHGARQGILMENLNCHPNSQQPHHTMSTYAGHVKRKLAETTYSLRNWGQSTWLPFQPSVIIRYKRSGVEFDAVWNRIFIVIVEGKLEIIKSFDNNVIMISENINQLAKNMNYFWSIKNYSGSNEKFNLLGFSILFLCGIYIYFLWHIYYIYIKYQW